MKRMNLLLLVIITSFVSSAYSQPASSLYPQHLTCEYLTNPLGLDEPYPRFSWTFKAANDKQYGQRQTAYQILVSSSKNILNKNAGDIWDSKWVPSDEMQLIDFKGRPLISDRNYFWKVRVKDEKGRISSYSETAAWSSGLFNKSDWKAKWIGTDQTYDVKQADCNVIDPWLRKSFTLGQTPAKATMFVASVGYHELYVNGKKIGDHILAPAVTDHSKRARYIAYDISKELKTGNNVIGLWLGTSWSIFAPYATNDKPRSPIVIAQAAIYDKNGRNIHSIETNSSWKTHYSPNKLLGNWSFSNMGGEIWDANKEIDNWNQVNYNDAKWENAKIFSPDLKLSAQVVQTNRTFDEIHPVKIEERPDGSYRVDMGINFSGWTRIKVNGRPGERINFLFSEREQEEMTFNNRSAYIIGKKGTGYFQNKFNYGSGRWITIKGLTAKPALEDIKGWVVRTDYPIATKFTSSDSLQNWINNKVRWNFENLTIGGYVVDCAQRERMGYGGDAHATSEAGMFNYKLGAFYTKWMEDWRDVQGTEPMVGDMNDSNHARKGMTSGRVFNNGILPHTAPTYWGGGGPAWGGICVSLPWYIYEHEGDKRILEKNFEMIAQWLSFLDTHTKNNILQRFGGKWDFLGDWLWPNATAEGMNNDKPETLCLNNCFRVYNLRTAAKIARVIGKDAYAKKWERQADESSRAIHATFYNASDFSYADSSMSNMAAAILAEVPPVHLRSKIMDRIEKDIVVVHNGFMHAGITGGTILFKVLRDSCRDDLLYSMTSQTAYPSWGYMKENGATSLWEMWEKDLPGHSLLHSSFLYPGAWYIDGVAGIRRDISKPGFRRFIIRVPALKESEIKWASASFDSPAGLIESSWKKENGKLQLSVTVPPNCTATVFIPASDPQKVSEASGVPKFKDNKKGYLSYEVPSGKYLFSSK